MNLMTEALRKRAAAQSVSTETLRKDALSSIDAAAQAVCQKARDLLEDGSERALLKLANLKAILADLAEVER